MLIIGELLKQADLFISEVSAYLHFDGVTLSHSQGLHPRIVAEGVERAKLKALEVSTMVTPIW